MKKGLLLLLGCAALCRGAETLLSGPDIYAGMLATYAEARSYEDEGEVRTVFFESRGQRTDIKPFTTAFVRPDAFRFEFKNRYNPGDEWDRYLLWQNGETVKTWWSIQPGIRDNQTFEDAISAATGVSGSSSANVTFALAVVSWSICWRA